MGAKRIILLTAITVLLIASTAVPALALLPNGQSAPNFRLTDLSGNVHTLSDYRGKVVVIDFFGYACSACISDAQNNLVPLYNTYYKNDANVQFLSVEVNGGSAAQIQQYLQETGVPWLVLTGGGSLVSTYDFQSTPTLYVIDPAGNVALSMPYPTNVQTLKSTIDALEGSAPAVCFSGTVNTLDLFMKGTGNYLYWKHSADGGTTWGSSQSLGGSLTSSPAATSRNSGGMTVFVRGTDGAIYYRDYVAGSWGHWTSIGGKTAAGTAPAVCSWGGGRLDVFAQGTDGSLYHKSYTSTAGWANNWDSLGGKLTSSPAATAPGSRIIVFARGSDNGLLWEKTYNGGWSAWTPIAM